MSAQQHPIKLTPRGEQLRDLLYGIAAIIIMPLGVATLIWELLP